ncbi:MAG: class I SAM-dependent methyltransferase [Oscillospiraceae bacterium]|nr:class I SAM-dependent methyltransferase [Oscillospiraceae bacterium]
MNEEKFTGKADVYDKFRPSYPKELIDILYEKTQAETVADIGAGTGIFTKCLSAKPWKITAVEPNGDMLEVLKQNAPFADIVNASAENTGIPSGTVDLVTAAQAFHWFDKENFKIECQRIFTSKGHLAVVWNNHVKSDIMSERNRIFDKYCGMSNSVAGGVTQVDLKAYFSRMEVFNLNNNMNMTEEQFIGYSLSHSYALKADNENYEKFVYELKNMFVKFQKNGMVEIPQETECFLGRFN